MMKLLALVGALCAVLGFSAAGPTLCKTGRPKCQSGSFLRQISSSTKGNGCGLSDDELFCSQCSGSYAFKITSVEALQSGKDIPGGLQLCDAATVKITGTSTHVPLVDPKINLKLYDCDKSFFGGCDWHASIANGLLPDFKPCNENPAFKIYYNGKNDCHMDTVPRDGQPHTVEIIVDLTQSSTIKSNIHLLQWGHYDDLEVSISDGNTVVACEQVVDYVKTLSC